MELSEWTALAALLKYNENRSVREILSEDALVRLALNFVYTPTFADQLRLMIRDPAPEFYPALVPGASSKPELVEIALSVSDDSVANSTAATITIVSLIGQILQW